jgi:hypothetical protein
MAEEPQTEKPFVGKFEIKLHGACGLPKADLFGSIGMSLVCVLLFLCSARCVRYSASL